MKKKMMTAKQAAETPLAYDFEGLTAHFGVHGGFVVEVPTHVAHNQKEFDRTQQPFPVKLRDGSYRWARLNGNAYGLHTAGTGDMRVSPPRWKRVWS